MDRLSRLSLCFLACLGWALFLSFPPLLRAGDEAVVNNLTLSAQERPALAQLKGGSLVVVWESLASGVRSIWLRRFSATGTPLATNQLVFAAAGIDQSDASVTALDGGGFVVAWSRRQGDGSDYGVAFQIFNATGTPQLAQAAVANTTTVGPQFKPKVVGLASGGFVVGWVGQSNFGDQQVFHRRFSSSGSPLDVAEVVSNGAGNNGVQNGDQGSASLARLSDGGFVVVYEDRPTAQVYGVRFNASGLPVVPSGQPNGAAQFLVATNLSTEFSEPSVAGLAGGGFVVALTGSSGGPTARKVYHRLFSANGIGGITTQTGNHPNRWQTPAALSLPNGEYVVAWQALGEIGDPGSWSIWAQRFSSNGTPRLTAFQVNQFNAGHQRKVGLASRSDSGYGAGWQSFGVDKDDYGIAARWFDPDNEIPGRLVIERFGVPAKQQYLITFIGMGGRTHQLQATESLKPAAPAWSTVLITNTTSGTFSYLETGSNRPPRFFRVLTP